MLLPFLYDQRSFSYNCFLNFFFSKERLIWEVELMVLRFHICYYVHINRNWGLGRVSQLCSNILTFIGCRFYSKFKLITGKIWDKEK